MAKFTITVARYDQPNPESVDFTLSESVVGDEFTNFLRGLDDKARWGDFVSDTMVLEISEVSDGPVPKVYVDELIHYLENGKVFGLIHRGDFFTKEQENCACAWLLQVSNPIEGSNELRILHRFNQLSRSQQIEHNTEMIVAGILPSLTVYLGGQKWAAFFASLISSGVAVSCGFGINVGFARKQYYAIKKDPSILERNNNGQAFVAGYQHARDRNRRPFGSLRPRTDWLGNIMFDAGQLAYVADESDLVNQTRANLPGNRIHHL